MSRQDASPPTIAMFRNDEPSGEDRLGRGRYAAAFARLATSCDTPVVVGLYGTWGVGKTSLMLSIRDMLKDEDVPTVWFDPWRYQFDEDPIIALLQTMTTELRLEVTEGVKEILMTIAAALSSTILKAGTGLSYQDVKKMTDAMAEERFRVRNHQIKLREEIKSLIGKAKRKDKPIVFFIDDLDRCLPAKMLRMLEALKLYLNVENCVYFLGLDHTVVKKGIENEYAELAISDQDYLDKIVQIPFLIPPIHEQNAREFIEKLLPEDSKHCAEILVEFLGDNPRRVKRFINNLSLNLLLASEIFGEKERYEIALIVVLLLIQHRNEALFRQIKSNWKLYFELRASSEEMAKQLTEDYFDGDTQLQGLVQRVECPNNAPIERLVYLTNVAGASVRREETRSIEPQMVTLRPGSFDMGSDGDDTERPVHKVTIEYLMAVGRHPVTFDEYDRFVDATDRRKQGDEGWGRGLRPVINVSWEDATAYVEWLSKETGKVYRLLSEAEWEYACRAGTDTPYSCGTEITEADANFGEKVGKTTKVGSFLANPWGLYDMHGNIWEWVEDVWHENYDGAACDGSAWTKGRERVTRVLRGGSWYYPPAYLRSTFRHKFNLGFRDGYTGFRVARTL